MKLTRLVLLFAVASPTLLPTHRVFAQFSQQGQLRGTYNEGYSVAVSADGSTALTGAPGTIDLQYGQAHAWTRSGGTWRYAEEFQFTNASGKPRKGHSVALSADGNTAIVGGPSDSDGIGAAWIFTRSGSRWSYGGTKLVGTGAVGHAQQGQSVALSADGSIAVVGGFQDDGGVGATWVFAVNGGVWTQQGTKLIGLGAVGAAQQGQSVSISANGTTVMVGGFQDDSGTGATWVFTRSGAAWTQQGPKLVASGAVGPARQGQSVSLSADGNTAAIGGSYDSSLAGAAWVFTRSGGVWTQQGPKLVGSDAVGYASLGRSVSLSADGNTVLVGGDYDNSLAGASWVFARSGGVWTQQGTKLVGSGAVGNARQGFSVALSADGTTAIVGGFLNEGGNGAAWIFSVPAPVNPQTLTVTKVGTGTGTVASDPSGVACGTRCSAGFNPGAIVTLTASASTGSYFNGWSGECVGMGVCQLTMSHARNVTATFTASPASPETLLLSQDRVSVTLDWRSQYSGATGKGTGVKQMDQYGYFWFDSAGNPEVFVKALDFGGDSYLVFHSALSDLEYTVNFKVLRTGQTYSFRRAPGSVCGLADGTTVKK